MTFIETIEHFQIIPNFHPIFVHFTVALVSIAFILHGLAYLGSYRASIKDASWLREIAVTGRWCLWLAMLFAVLTVLAGLQAYFTVLHNEAGHEAMQIHRNSALISLVLILLTGSVSIKRFIKKQRLSLPFMILFAVTQLSVLTTAYLGAEVVFRYGVGVIAAQTPDMAEGHHHHDMSDMPGM